MGVALLLVGFGFKVAAVPFHMWAPDVYEGAPTPITAYMAAAVKAAAFAAFIRVWVEALPDVVFRWHDALWFLAVLTMLVGNIVALAQRNIKRMLAYSSIAQAGYVLVAVVAGHDARGIGVPVLSGRLHARHHGRLRGRRRARQRWRGAISTSTTTRACGRPTRGWRLGWRSACLRCSASPCSAALAS